MWLWVVTFVCVIFGLLYTWFKISFNHFENRGIKGPKPRFPYGNLLKSLFMQKSFIHDHADIYKEFKGKSAFVGYFEMQAPKFFAIDPETVKIVMVKNFKNFHDNEFSKMSDKESEPLFSRNPFMLTGEEWKEKRAEITPGFTPNRIKALFPLVEEILDRLKKHLNENQDVGLEGREICAKYTTDVVSSCIFNADAESFTRENPEIRTMGRRIFQMTPLIIAKFYLYAFFPFLSKIKKMKFVPKDVEDFFIELVGQAVKQREKDKIQRDDYLAYLLSLRAKKELKDIDIAAHGISFFVDGFDTSSLAICHTLFEIGNNKNIQEKLRDEIQSIFDENGKIIYENLVDNEYLDQVFHEGMRMHPPALVLNRECTEAMEMTDLDGTKHQIKVGDSFNIPVYPIHYDSEYYDEPEKFKPERFDAEHGGVKAFRDKGVYLTFGDGPRICLGMRFALMQSKAAIAMIVKNFEISVDEKTKFPLEVDPKDFLNSKVGGLWMKFKPIKQ